MLGSLAAPVQDATSAPWHGGAILAGGLTAADTSTSNVVLVRARGRASPLPLALHDATAAALGGAVYLFGGGDGVRQLDGIIRVAPGAPATVGRLPAAELGPGGCGARRGGVRRRRLHGHELAEHDRPLAPRRPRRGSSAICRCRCATPRSPRSSGRIVIAGGSTPAGTASDAVLSFDPATGRVTRIGRLPSPTTHAAAAALGTASYVIGGRGATVDTPTASIEAVDPLARKVVPAGMLDSARSDLAAVGLPGRILLAGGRDGSGTVATVSELVPHAAGRRPPCRKLVDPHNVYAADTPGQSDRCRAHSRCSASTCRTRSRTRST